MTEKEEQLYQDRLKKLEALKKLGVDPYPTSSERTHTVQEVLNKFEKLTSPSPSSRGGEISLVGRIRGLRGHGGVMFGDLEDISGKIQFVLKKDQVDEKGFAIFQDHLDVGDIVQIAGTTFETKRKEKSILVGDYKLLTKSLRALPEKYHGLKDTETRLRKRYLDFLANPETRELFVKKSLFWQSVRNFLQGKGFLEVETPVLEHVPGGAEAEPFVTHYNALDQDFFLRISLELPLKRLLVGGFEKVFEIGRIFRNEGVSAEHLQDYTQMEFYWAYADYHDLMKLLEEMYRDVVKKTCGTLRIENDGVKLDWGKPWKRYDFYKLFNEHAGIDLKKADLPELKKTADKLGIKYEKFAQKGRLIDLIYKKTVRPKLVQPGFLLDPPVEIEPLAKRVAKNPERVQRLQIMAWGTELGKGFSELNDPLDQRARFEEQMKLRQAGDSEAQRLDDDYVEAQEYGMPPNTGFGMSERFFAVLMGKPIRETVIFPPMRNEHD